MATNDNYCCQRRFHLILICSQSQFVVVVFFNERCVTIVTVLLFGARTWPPRREKANARNYSQKL